MTWRGSSSLSCLSILRASFRVADRKRGEESFKSKALRFRVEEVNEQRKTKREFTRKLRHYINNPSSALETTNPSWVLVATYPPGLDRATGDHCKDEESAHQNSRGLLWTRHGRGTSKSPGSTGVAKMRLRNDDNRSVLEKVMIVWMTIEWKLTAKCGFRLIEVLQMKFHQCDAETEKLSRRRRGATSDWETSSKVRGRVWTFLVGDVLYSRDEFCVWDCAFWPGIELLTSYECAVSRSKTIIIGVSTVASMEVIERARAVIRAEWTWPIPVMRGVQFYASSILRIRGVELRLDSSYKAGTTIRNEKLSDYFAVLDL
ncbi:uncharacterized protein LY89DRAFT_666291 [Mollisia scopiformis]|uniref:Uncharacterized protein n=1 Tax=Mollisia scopiformis TaxID=149040 RepID=A0A194XKE6_MOLSC|nr:uncharacterized protein LY89DRAFT_666291 [Mollisia scopiformis]KUJ20633.1 hypothetical protein LY89DRAFT_666291 [Mollisia scopiformis]